ncbi:MAG: purine-nucleoside phosphorylase [Bacteroidales bacterium]|nr:purine-nucleoside phosphorylase [Bacteroidales bacterium]
MLQRIKESADYILDNISLRPVAGIILGSGLGSFAEEITILKEISFSAVPHFPAAGVEGHKGALLLGTLNDIPVVVMQGRVHFYEGFTVDEVCYPVRVMKYLGIEKLFLTNAAGGMNPEFEIGDIMIIEDHINLMPNPLIGKNEAELGPRFPDMSTAYDPALKELAGRIATRQSLKVRKGVYVGVTGPSYETPAEYKFFRIIGGDAVGMSTVAEVIVARHMGIKCFALSVITDLGVPGRMEFLTHDMVRAAAAQAEPKMAQLLKELIRICPYSADNTVHHT